MSNSEYDFGNQRTISESLNSTADPWTHDDFRTGRPDITCMHIIIMVEQEIHPANAYSQERVTLGSVQQSLSQDRHTGTSFSTVHSLYHVDAIGHTGSTLITWSIILSMH